MQSLTKFVIRLRNDLARNVYSEEDKKTLEILRPLIDLRNLALKTKESSATHVAALYQMYLTMNLDSEIQRILETSEKLCFTTPYKRFIHKDLIKVCLNSKNKMFKDIEIIIHAVCVAAASRFAESVIESMVSIYEVRNNKLRPISEEQAQILKMLKVSLLIA